MRNLNPEGLLGELSTTDYEVSLPGNRLSARFTTVRISLLSGIEVHKGCRHHYPGSFKCIHHEPSKGFLMKSLLLGSGAVLVAAGVAQAADLPVRKAAPVEYVRVVRSTGSGSSYPGPKHA